MSSLGGFGTVMGKKVLVLEDNLEVQRLIRACLQNQEVIICDRVEDARKVLSDGRVIDLFVLDVNLPDGDGLAFCMEIQKRKEYENVPIIFCSGKDEVSDRVAGLILGAEDYITKPFNVLELRTRFELRLVKAQKTRESGQTFSRGDLQFDVSRQILTHSKDGQAKPISLTAFEFKLLSFMARNEDHVLTRNQILEAVWGPNVFIIERTIDSHMSNLRRKLKGTSFTISSVYGQGYRFSEKSEAKFQAAA